MEISEMPYDDRFQNKVRELEVTDPEIENFFFELAAINNQSRKNLLVEKKYREILEDITKYTEDQILQYAAVFLKFSPNLNFFTGTMMKKWKEQQETSREESELVSGIIQVSVSEDVSKAT